MNEKILKQLQWRYAVKKFDSTKKIPTDHWHVLEESLRLSPSSYGLQPWKFILVQNPDIRRQLTAVSWNQPQVETCSHYVVLAALHEMTEAYVKNYFESVYKIRALPQNSLTSYEAQILKNIVHGPKAKDLIQWSSRQVYIALGTFMTVASLLEIDTCPMEGIQAEKYDSILGLENTPYRTVVCVAAGYRSPEDKAQFEKKVRFAREDVFSVI